MLFYSGNPATQTMEEDIRKIIGVPLNISYEIQDEGDFLLMRVELPERPSKMELDMWCTELKKHFSSIFPKPKPGQGYSWMINIEHERWPLETVMDEISMS